MAPRRRIRLRPRQEGAGAATVAALGPGARVAAAGATMAATAALQASAIPQRVCRCLFLAGHLRESGAMSLRSFLHRLRALVGLKVLPP